MTSSEHDTNQQAFQYLDMEGIRVMVGPGDRKEVIRKAMVDLNTTIDGCMAQTLNRDILDALARQCSIFLRKMAIGDDRNPPLLDIETCKAAGIQFHKLRAVRGERQRVPVIHHRFTNRQTHITLKIPETGQSLGEMSHQSGDPWEFSIHTDWPLPGLVSWTGLPTPETPWTIFLDKLFDLNTVLDHDCKRWLGQQLVLFDNQSVTLGDAIRAVINTEGAHAPLTVPLMQPQDSNRKGRSDTLKNPGAYILLCMITEAISYAHVIAIEAGLYLYLLVAQSGLIQQFSAVDSVPDFHITSSAAGSSHGRILLGFEGSVVLPIHSEPGTQQETHTARVPRPR